MAEVISEVKQWGDSFAVIIPKHVARHERITLHDTVHLKIEKKVDLTDIFGIAKGKISATVQELKNEARKGWD